MTWIVDPVRRAHAEDRAYLDTLSWQPGVCVIGRHESDRTTEFAHIEQGTLPGHPLLICREHAAHDLTLARAEAAKNIGPYVPDLRRQR